MKRAPKTEVRRNSNGEMIPNVFTKSKGGELFSWPVHYSHGVIGWREMKDGKREVVKYDAYYDDWRNKQEFENHRYGGRSEGDTFETVGDHKFRGKKFGWLTDAQYIARLEQELGIKKG